MLDGGFLYKGHGSDFPRQFKGCHFMHVLECLDSVPLREHQYIMLVQEWSPLTKTNDGFQHNTDVPHSFLKNKYNQ